MAEIGPTSALVYQALWIHADDSGMCLCDPETIKARAFFRWSAVGVPEITGALRTLSALGRVQFFRGGDEWFCQIVRWRENQPVHKPSKFTYRDDYHKRGKDLVESVPEWCSTGEALVTVQLPDTSTSRHPDTPTSRHPVSRSAKTLTGGNGKLDGEHPPEKQPTWVQQAVEIWAKYQGVITHGKAGKLLKPLLASHTEAELIDALKTFASGEKAKYGLAYFVEHFAECAKESNWFTMPDGTKIRLIDDDYYKRAGAVP